MTGADIQANLDKIILDLQTTQKGKTASILLRSEDNVAGVFPLSSDGAGNIDAAQLTAINDYLVDIKNFASSYATASAPVSTASEVFTTARKAHQVLIDDAKVSRDALTAALDADANYQTAKANYDTARTDPAYVNARDAYKTYSVSENAGNLSDARGKYY